MVLEVVFGGGMEREKMDGVGCAFIRLFCVVWVAFRSVYCFGKRSRLVQVMFMLKLIGR